MTTYNVMPPNPKGDAVGSPVNFSIDGRNYTCNQGSSIQVPDFDAKVMFANGWGIIRYIPNGSARPINPEQWVIWFDANSAIQSTIWWNGTHWVRPSSGGLV